MNLSIPKRFIIITLISYAAAFILFLLINFINFAPKEIDLYFKTGWVIHNSLLMFFNNLISIQGAAIIFTFSVFYPKIKSESGMEIITSKNLSDMATFVIIILLVLTALFFGGSEILKPRIHEKLDSYSYLTKTSRAYLENAKKAESKANLLEAEELITRYLAIKPEDEEGENLHKRIKARIENIYRPVAETEKLKIEDSTPLDMTYEDALVIAGNYINEEDYYSAYYYASIAAKLSNNAEDALALSSRAWSALSKAEPSKEDIEAYELYSEKKKGAELLLEDRPINAYYLFKELAVDYPEDPDVKQYLDESIEKTKGKSYFIDEAVKILNLPGISDVCFINSQGENSDRELFFFGKIVISPEGTFFENFEAVSFNEKGTTLHVTSKYGKLAGSYIILNGIDRENQRLTLTPEYIIAEKNPDAQNLIKLNIKPHRLANLSSSRNLYKKMSIIELYEFEPVITSYGWPVKPLYIEIITRVLNPCAFIILSLITIALSWKYRSLSNRLPLGSLIFSPLVIYIITLFYDSYIYSIRLLCTWIYLGFGKPAAFALLAASQIILIIAAFIMIAGLKTSERQPHLD